MSEPTVIVFIRHPAPGAAKTRLIPALGTHGAALAQHRMTLRTLDAVRQVALSRQVTIELHVSGDLDAATQLYPGPWKTFAQSEGDLGARLTSAIHRGFQNGGPVIVVGSDCPQLTSDCLGTAFDALSRTDVVIGPAVDGGYYLLGLRRLEHSLFSGIDWSTARVAAQTRAAAQAAGLSVSELPFLGDVDEPRDLSLLPIDYAPNHIAITGATGSLGTQFLAYLLPALPSLRITAVARPAPMAMRSPAFQKLISDFGSRITIIEQDLQDIALSPSQRRDLIESDGLWHFAANTQLNGDPDDDWAGRANLSVTMTLLDLLKQSNRPSPFMHVSTAFVSGTKTGVIRENDWSTRTFRNGYEASKFAAEMEVRAAFAKGLRGCIFRPSVVIGDASDGGKAPPKMIDRFIAAMFSSIRVGDPLVLRLPADASLNCVHADWVMATMTALAGGPAFGGKVYHLTARESFRLSDLAAFARVQPGDWKILFQPTARSSKLPPASRLLDRMIAPLIPYLTADVRFDRRNLEVDAPAMASATELDIGVVLQLRGHHALPAHRNALLEAAG